MIYLLFIIGFMLLIKGADWLVDGAASIARRLKVSNLVIGLTIVAFGTSMPELVVSVLASLSGNADIAIGNVLGSNIANVFLILGLAALIYPLTVHRNTVWYEIPFTLLAMLMLAVLVNDRLIDQAPGSILSRIDGLVLLGFFVIFLYYTVSMAKTGATVVEGETIQQLSTIRSLIYVVAGLSGLVVGGKWIVDGAVVIAAKFGMSQSLIGLTIVAVGTSLPELAASAVAAYKHQSDIAIGNVVGSNIFNVFWILGFSSVIRPLPFNTINNFDVAMATIASLLLFGCLFVGRRHTIDRWQGVLFILIYAGYIAVLIIKSRQ